MSIVGKWFGFGKDESYDAGVRAYELGDFSEAISRFGACLAATHDPDVKRLARLYRGLCHAHLGRRALEDRTYEVAAEQFQQAIELNPAYPDLHYHLAEALGGAGQADAEMEQLTTALRLNPNYAMARLRMALRLYERGRFEEGLEHLVTAVRAQCGIDPSAYRELAAAHSRGDHEQALGLLRSLSASPPHETEQQVQLAEMHVRARRFVEASHAYEAALTLTPDYADLRFRYGETLLEQDRVEEASDQFRAAIAINPHYADAHAFLGIALRRLGHAAESKKAFENALSSNPNHPIASAEVSRAL